MKFSEHWLREWVNPELDTTALAEQLSMAGLEVDAVESVAGDFSGVVVAEVVSAQPHPDADKLSVCQVNDGTRMYQVVCGAANVRAGLKVALARVSAVLSPEFRIKAAKLRGVESQGMLCSADELRLADAADGIMELAGDAPLGQDLRQYLRLDDQVIDVDLTPNRGDCLSIAGLAREVGAINGLEVKAPEIAQVLAAHQETFPVKVDAPADCPRYCGRVIKDIEIGAPTPLWLVERLRRAGLRSIDAVVDVTNYVMLELGQPMHAFDLDTLVDAIEVRSARAGEQLKLLDGKEVTLDENTLVIADGRGPLALAGIMGGEHSGVSASTKNIFLESAFFSTLTVAGKARGFGLHTDSSHRFERGVDFVLQERAVERATALLLDIVGGTPGPVISVESKKDLPQQARIRLRRGRVKELLQVDLAAGEITGILSRLGLELDNEDADSWTFTAPSYRFDLSIEEDLIEEIARIYGYNKLPTSLPAGDRIPRPASETQLSLAAVRRTLMTLGYYEAITYSFVDPQLQRQLEGDEGAITLANPIASDMSVMRKSLWPGLIQALRYNLNRQQQRVRLFESGLVFHKRGGEILQRQKIGGVISGLRQPESWQSNKEKVDFFDIKGHVEALLALNGRVADFEFRPGSHPALHPGRCAEICDNGEPLGYLGALHPQLERALEIEIPVMLFELDWEAFAKGSLAAFSELSKFPEVRRDLAIIVEESVPLAAVIKLVKECAGEALTDVSLFDLYRGETLGPGRKSLALGLTWQHRSRTLTEKEISQLVDSIINNLEKEFNAVLRG